MEALLSDDRTAFVDREPAGLEHQWKRFALVPTPSRQLWMDAYLAAFAVAGGFRMVTLDQGFRQFSGLDVLVLGSGSIYRPAH